MQAVAPDKKHIFLDKNCATDANTLSVLNNIGVDLSTSSTPVRLAHSLGFDWKEFNKSTISRLQEGKFGVIKVVHNFNKTKSFAVKFPKERGKKFFNKENEILLKLLQNNGATSYVIEVGEILSSKNHFVLFAFDTCVPVFGIIKYEYDLHDYLNKEFFDKDYNECTSQNNIQFALKFVGQLLEAVDFIHSNNVTHRDLKPENILYDKRDGRWKLCDFGLAANGVDQLEGRLGTAEFIAPEVFKDATYNFKVDMWSVGCIIYKVLTGQPLPDVNKNTDQTTHIEKTIFYRKSDVPIDLSGLPSITPQYLKALLKIMLNKNPKLRCTAAEGLECIKSRVVFENMRLKQMQESFRIQSIVALLRNLFQLMFKRWL
ncbi:MAG: serine/threonine-protein kinase [Pseudomonadota bacterium]